MFQTTNQLSIENQTIRFSKFLVESWCSAIILDKYHQLLVDML